MAVKKGLGGLGKGLDALIPKTEEEIKDEVKIKDGAMLLDIDKVEPNRNQPRKKFDEDALNELAESIQQHGVISPILVQKKDDYYEIIAGERRWRASKIAGLKQIPATVKDLSAQEIVEISLIENIQREDLNPIEEAMAYKRLIDEYNLKQDEVAKRVSKQRATVANSIRLLKLDDKVQQMLVDGMISAGHARAILGLPESEDQCAFAEKIFDERISVREAEKYVKNLQKEKKTTEKKKTSTQLDAVLGETEERLKNVFGTKVSIKAKDSEKGVIEIEYYSKAQLSDIIDKLES